jgi:hypothetical protein
VTTQRPAKPAGGIITRKCSDMPDHLEDQRGVDQDLTFPEGVQDGVGVGWVILWCETECQTGETARGLF